MLLLQLAYILTVTFLLGTLVGWIAHWVSHQRWSGAMYRRHMVHHRLYPGTDVTSDQYRSAASDNSAFIFTPVIAIVLLGWLGFLIMLGTGLMSYIVVALVSVVVGWMHDWVHHVTHLRRHWLYRFAFMRRLSSLHIEHHIWAQANLGIIWFGWDRLFRTYRSAPPYR